MKKGDAKSGAQSVFQKQAGTKQKIIKLDSEPKINPRQSVRKATLKLHGNKQVSSNTIEVPEQVNKYKKVHHKPIIQEKLKEGTGSHSIKLQEGEKRNQSRSKLTFKDQTVQEQAGSKFSVDGNGEEEGFKMPALIRSNINIINEIEQHQSKQNVSIQFKLKKKSEVNIEPELKQSPSLKHQIEDNSHDGTFRIEEEQNQININESYHKSASKQAFEKFHNFHEGSYDIQSQSDQEEDELEEIEEIRFINQDENGSVIEEVSDESSHSIESKSDAESTKAEEEYLEKFIYNAYEDPYFIEVTICHDFKWLLQETWYYKDQFYFLYIRKLIFFFISLLNVICYKIVNSWVFDMYEILLTFSNIILLLTDSTQDHNKEVLSYQYIFLCLYFVDVFIQLLGKGIKVYVTDMWNLYDFIILITYAIYIFKRDLIPLDVSTFRIIRIPFYFGRLDVNLKIMLTSLQSSFKYIVENIAVLILFSALLSLIAMNLFQGVLKNRCMVAETGIFNPAHHYEESVCGYTKCHEEGEICAKYISNVEFPSSYDNFYFSYTQIIRITLINDWTITMYMLMKQFHPIVCLYYILIIFILDKFCFQLVIAVLKTYYHRTTEYYHENPMLPDFIEDQVRMNLRALKNLSLWNQLQQGGMLYKRNPLILEGNDIAIDNSFSSGSLNDLMTKQNVNKEGQEKKKDVTKLLSARQMNEMGLYKLQMKEKYELQSWVWKILFPKQYLKEYMIHQIDKKEELFIQYYDLELFYRFKTCDFLSMRLNVVNKPFQSESQNDVILEKKNKIKIYKYDRLEMKYQVDQILSHLEDQRIDKRKFILPVIRKNVRIAQYMVQSNDDSSSQTSRYHKEMIEEYQLDISSISRRKPPKEKTILRQKFFQNNQKMTFEQQIQKAREQNLSKIDAVNAISTQILIIDGKEYTFKDVNQLFLKKDDENPKKEIKDYNKLYELYRQVEITNKKISQKNWSGNDVLLPQNQKYFKLYSLLTLLNLGWNFQYSKGLSYILGSIQFQMYIFITSPLTTILIDTYICLNTLIISLENYVGTTVNFYTDVLLEIILMLELFMKALTVKGYFRDRMNVLQGIINIISTTEPFLTLAFSHEEEWQDYLVIMRVCRAFFFFRVIKYNVFASNMISISYQVIPSFANLFLLLFFLIINYAIFGMQLFREKFPEEDLLTQVHFFDNVYRSWIAVFDISTGDDWYGVVILSTTYSYTYISLIYCISFVFIVIYIFFGLLLAIILDGFNEYMKHQLEDDDSEDAEIVIATESDEAEKPKFDEINRVTKEISSYNEVPQVKQKILFQFTQLLESVVKPETEEKYKLEVTNKKTFFYFSKENKFRKLSYIITQSQAVIYLMSFITWGSLINMAAITYYDYEAQFQGLQTIQAICNSFIFVDGLLTMVAIGAFDGYFNGVWITVDYIYVIFYFFNLGINHPILDGLMFLGYLRPFKVVSYHGMFQNERDAIYYSLKDIISIVYVILMFWLIFGIFGMTLFSNKFGYCDEITNMGVGKHHCEGEWKIYPFNFDTIFNSMVTLFAISTFDWLCSIWYMAINSNTEEFGPTRFKNEWPAYVFFVSFLLIGSIFLLGFLAGIIFVNFTQKKSQLINPHLTLDQELFLKISDTIMKETPGYSDPAKKGIRLMAKNLLNNRCYASTIRFLQFVNFIVLMTYQEDASDEYLKVLNYIHHGLSACLLFDLIVKLLTYHIRRYFGDTWRKIEFFFVVNSIIDLSLDLKYDWFMDYARSSREDPWFLYYRLYFVIRDLRLILIIQFFQKIRRLLNVISFNILTIFRILGLFVTFMVCYSYIGCQLYGQITEGQTMNDQLNFKNIGYAMLTLFKVQTRNFWRVILTDSTSENPYCHEEHHNCGRSWTLAVIYYISFVFISFYILMNLIVSQFVSEFERFYDSNSNVIEQYIECIDKFRNVWCKYTQEYKGKKMHTKYLAHFLLELGEPFGAQSGDNVWDTANTVSGFKLKADRYGCISFRCLLYECVKFRYRESIFKLTTPEGKKIMKLHDKKIRYRLYNLRDHTQRRDVVDQYIGLDSNFNILQEYFYLKMTFKAWIEFSRKFIEAAYNVENSAVFSEQDVISSDDQEQVVQQVKKVRRRTPSSENLRRPTDVYILQYYEKELKFKLRLSILNRFLEQKKKDDVGYIFKPQSQESKQKQQKVAPVMKKKQQILKIDDKRKYQEQAQGQIQRNRYQYGYHDKVPVPKYQLQSFATSEDYVVQSKLDLPSGVDVVNKQRKSVKFKQQ